MTRRLSYTRLSKSRFEALKRFAAGWMTARDLATAMWGDHRMALVNAKAVIRELKLADLLLEQNSSPPKFHSTEKARPILKNPSWICRYCSLDTTDSRKRLWAEPCMTCGEHHYACRRCKRHLILPTGDFPYMLKYRGCPGAVVIPQAPERKSRTKAEKSKEKGPSMVQGDLYGKVAP